MTGEVTEGANAEPDSTSVRDSQEVTDSQEEQPESQQQEQQEQQNNKQPESFRRKREKARIQIDESHYYDYDSLVSQPVISQDSNLSPMLLQLL